MQDWRDSRGQPSILVGELKERFHAEKSMCWALILSYGSPFNWFKLLSTYVSLEAHTHTQLLDIIYPSKIAALTWSTVSVSISNETIRTCALRLMVNDPAGGVPCTRVMHNARVNTLSVLTCIEGRAILIPCASIVNLRWCGW